MFRFLTVNVFLFSFPLLQATYFFAEPTCVGHMFLQIIPWFFCIHSLLVLGIQNKCIVLFINVSMCCSTFFCVFNNCFTHVDHNEISIVFDNCWLRMCIS